MSRQIITQLRLIVTSDFISVYDVNWMIGGAFLGSAGCSRQKLPHGGSDLLDVRFQYKVSRIKELHCRVWVISPIGFRA